MVRREQMKDLEATRSTKKAQLSKAADDEGKVEQVDLEELARQQRRQQMGTVTPESFAAWKVAFEEEMIAQAQACLDAGETLDRMQNALLGLDISDTESGKEIWKKKLDKGYIGDDEDADAVGECGGAEGDMGLNVVDEATVEAEARMYAEFEARKAKAEAGGAADDEEEEAEWSGSDSCTGDDSEGSFQSGDEDGGGEYEYTGKGGAGDTVFTGSRPVTRGMKSAGK